MAKMKVKLELEPHAVFCKALSQARIYHESEGRKRAAYQSLGYRRKPFETHLRYNTL